MVSLYRDPDGKNIFKNYRTSQCPGTGGIVLPAVAALESELDASPEVYALRKRVKELEEALTQSSMVF